jgi:hypothetical protein
MVFRIRQSQHAKALRAHPEDYHRCPKCDELISDKDKCIYCEHPVTEE